MTTYIITPGKSDEPLTDFLEEITKAIYRRDPDLIAHGILGGEFGYGGRWENDIFMMHPFCWCEEDTCPWCFYNVTWEKPQLASALIKGADNEHAGGIAPHFWHKPTGMKVWWYKWIGRDMESVNLPDDLSPILSECLASIK